MALFSDAYLTQLLDDAEKQVSNDIKCLFNYFSLAVTQGTAEYTLPATICGIHMISFKGTLIDPLTHQDIDFSSWMKPQNLSVESIPKFYVRLGYGYNKIKFHPIPNESISADDTDLDSIDGIKRRVIIYCYKISDPSGTIRLPSYLRRNVVKYIAMSKAYMREGKTQNLSAAGYFAKRAVTTFELYRQMVFKVPRAVVLQFGPAVDRSRLTPPRPVLPSSGKWAL